jgi:hypothetical protein
MWANEAHRNEEERAVISRRRRFTLMPLIALAVLSLMVALPALSNVRLYAAVVPHYATVTVQPGDTLWSIASAHAPASADIQEMIDQISAVNHLGAAPLLPGQRLRIPE